MKMQDSAIAEYNILLVLITFDNGLDGCFSETTTKPGVCSFRSFPS